MSSFKRSNSGSSLSHFDSFNDDSSLSSSPPPAASPMQQRLRREQPGQLTPVVTAMLRSNTMKDCYQVTDMYRKCQESQSSDKICDTAKNYFTRCMKK